MDIIREAISLGIKKANDSLNSSQLSKLLESHLAAGKSLTNEEMAEKLGVAVIPVWKMMDEAIQRLFRWGVKTDLVAIRGTYPADGIQNGKYLLGYVSDQPMEGFSDVRVDLALGMRFVITPAGKMFPSCQIFCFADILGNLRMADSELMVEYKLAEFVKEVVFLREMKRI